MGYNGNKNKQYKKGNRKGFIQSGMVYADTANKQEYATVEKAFGNCAFSVITIKGEQRVGVLSGKIRKNCRVGSGDLVLIEPMGDNVNGKYLIIHRYLPNDKRTLEKEGHLKTIEQEKEDDVSTEEDAGFFFEGEQEYKQDTEVVINENFVDDI